MHKAGDDLVGLTIGEPGGDVARLAVGDDPLVILWRIYWRRSL